MRKPRQLKPGQERRQNEQRFARRLRARTRKERGRVPHRVTSKFVVPSTTTPGKDAVDNQLQLPKIMDLIDHYDETVEFIHDMRRAVRAPNRRVVLDFDQVERIGPTAMLLLLSDLHRFQIIYTRRRITGLYPKDPRIEALLETTGFFEVLGVKHRLEAKQKAFPFDHIKFITDNSTTGSQVSVLRERLFGGRVTMPDAARFALYRVVTEAMTNVVQHAYPPDQGVRAAARNRWWLSGSVNRLRKELTIAFCDLGVGIPRTLPKLYAMEKIWAILSLLPGVNPNDGDMIKAGMELGRSQTGQSNRGKGLNDLRSFIDVAKAGSLYIFSNHGEYQYKGVDNEVTRDHRRSIGGTLIKWTVPMERVTDWKGDDRE